MKNTNEELPQRYHNVFVCHTIEFQDYWTRGYLCGEVWAVMTWKGKIEVPFEDIKYWMPFPKNN